MDDAYVIDLLVHKGVLTDAEASRAKNMQIDTPDRPIVECLVELEILEENDFYELIAQEYGMEFMSLTDYKIPPDVLSALDGDTVRRFRVIPIMHHEHMLRVGVADPTDFESIDAVRCFLPNEDIEPVICKQADIERVIKINYSSAEDKMTEVISDVTASLTTVTQDLDEDPQDDQAEESSLIRLVGMLIIEAYRNSASDIHLEPLEKRFRVRYRIDGVLQEFDNPPKYLQAAILQRIKIMAKLDITEKRVPQDGRINFKFPGKEIDLRVSSVPTVYGESIVMRILDKSSIMLGIAELGFFSDDQVLIDRILSFPDGIFLVTGPTGSGKTTSLYAFLNTINTPNRKIITAEDPVEYDLPGINQVQCDKSIGMTFALALRAMLRLAPNIIMVGEIRDIETGAIAINAALTGHLVFSTLHTNDAPSAITRLLDMGIKPFLVASGVKAVMAQRLGRRICKNCKREVEPEPEELRLLELDADFFKDTTLLKGAGCGSCSNGYKGRLGFYEIMMVTEEIIPMIFAGSPSDEIKARARELGMRTLRDDGTRKAQAGSTTLEEVIRVTKGDSEEEE